MVKISGSTPSARLFGELFGALVFGFGALAFSLGALRRPSGWSGLVRTITFLSLP